MLRQMLQRACPGERPSWVLGAVGLLAALGLYLVGAAQLGVTRWDGLAPTPYRYVSPPQGYANPGPPASATQTVNFMNGVSGPGIIATSDLQAQLQVPSGAFPPDAKGHAVTISIVPQAPPAIPSLGLYGNVYVVTAKYSSGAAAPEPWSKALTLSLTFPGQYLPQGIYRLNGSQATAISKTIDFPTLTAQAPINHAGAYVAGGAASGATGTAYVTGSGGAAGAAGGGIVWVAVAVGALVLIGIGVLIVARGRHTPPAP